MSLMSNIIGTPSISGGGGVDDVPSNIEGTGYYSDTAIWLDAYKQYGQNSYVYKSPEIWHELMTSYIGIIDPATTDLSYKYYIDNNLDIHKYYLYTDPTLSDSIPEGTTFSDIKKTTSYQVFMLKNINRLLKYMNNGGILTTELRNTYRKSAINITGNAFLISAQRTGEIYIPNVIYYAFLSGYAYKIYGSTTEIQVKSVSNPNSDYSMNPMISAATSTPDMINKPITNARTIDHMYSNGSTRLYYNTTFSYIPIPS